MVEGERENDFLPNHSVAFLTNDTAMIGRKPEKGRIKWAVGGTCSQYRTASMEHKRG